VEPKLSAASTSAPARSNQASAAEEPEPAAAASAWRPNVYRVDAATLRYIAQSTRVSAFRDVPDDALPFTMWRDGRAELGRLAEEIR